MKIIIKNKDWEVIKELEGTVNKTLLGQLTDAWVEIPNACRVGMCSACMCHIESGGEHLEKSFKWEASFPLWDVEIMTCIGWLKSEEEWEIVLKTIY